jgi:chloramphenicol O-acetyltransferase type A
VVKKCNCKQIQIFSSIELALQILIINIQIKKEVKYPMKFKNTNKKISFLIVSVYLIGSLCFNRAQSTETEETDVAGNCAKFNLVDMETYPRRKHYECFTKLACSYSYTVKVDITKLYNLTKQKKLKIYPALIWVLTSATNDIPEFRMSLDDENRLGIWESLSPTYMTMPKDGQVFSSLWTKINPNFMEFYNACITDIEKYTNGEFEPQGNIPLNVVNITTTPWIDFTSCSFYMPNHLLPILTIGKFTKENDKVTMPLAIQIHHAVCDAYHVGQFVEKTKELLEKSNEWMN